MENKYAQKKFAIFYDRKKKIPKQLHQQVKLRKLGRMPGLLIVDKQGVIRYAYYSDNMHDIPSNETLLEELKEINQN